MSSYNPNNPNNSSNNFNATKSSFPDLDTVLNTMNTLDQERKSQKPLWHPNTQMQLLARSSQEDINHPYNVGPNLLRLNQNSNNQDLFFQNYIKPQDAAKDFQTSMNNVVAVSSNTMNNNNNNHNNNNMTSFQKCQVYPPLLIRYHDPMNSKQDRYVAVKILKGGELRATTGVPDMILNFHADTHAITVTICQIDPNKIKDFELSIWALYSMFHPNVDDNMVDINSFTILYDQTRYELLKHISNYGK
jgi:hypothetical protein